MTEVQSTDGQEDRQSQIMQVGASFLQLFEAYAATIQWGYRQL